MRSATAFANLNPTPLPTFSTILLHLRNNLPIPIHRVYNLSLVINNRNTSVLNSRMPHRCFWEFSSAPSTSQTPSSHKSSRQPAKPSLISNSGPPIRTGRL